MTACDDVSRWRDCWRCCDTTTVTTQSPVTTHLQSAITSTLTFHWLCHAVKRSRSQVRSDIAHSRPSNTTTTTSMCRQALLIAHRPPSIENTTRRPANVGHPNYRMCRCDLRHLSILDLVTSSAAHQLALSLSLVGLMSSTTLIIRSYSFNLTATLRQQIT